MYGFTGDHDILKGTTKLAITMREQPQTSTVIVDFLVVKYPLAINRIIGRLLLKALKAVTSTYHLIMKFPTTEGIGEV